MQNLEDFSTILKEFSKNWYKSNYNRCLEKPKAASDIYFTSNVMQGPFKTAYYSWLHKLISNRIRSFLEKQSDL